MKKYWISWWSGNYADEGCTKPPFQFWDSGRRDRTGKTRRDDCSLCALVSAESEEKIWEAVKKHFPDYEIRFCNEVADTFNPSESGRFGGFENRTSLTFEGV